jgi:hypothetical protein
MSWDDSSGTLDGVENGVTVTDEDIRAAKRAWRRAADGHASSERVAMLHDSYRRLVSAQAQQIADDFRRRRSSEPGVA